MDQQQQNEISGILEKRRQNLKFHWRTYQFCLKGTNLSYYKQRGSSDKEGELWGTIDLRDVMALVSVEVIGSRYPMELTLRNGKVILLAADSGTERLRWIKVLQENMSALRKRRTSDTPVVRERSMDPRGICDWMRKSDPAHLDRGEATDEPKDLDNFIDKTFSGITFNRESQNKRSISESTQEKAKAEAGNT